MCASITTAKAITNNDMISLIQVKNMKKLLLASVLLPVLALAQTEATDTPATTTPIEIPAAESSAVPSSTSSPQEGTTSQETLPGDMLENGANPQTGATSTDATTTDSGTTTTTVTDPAPTPDNATTTDVIDVVEPSVDPVADVPVADLTPTKEYTFDLSGESIAAKETPAWSQTEEEKADASTTTVGSITDVPSVDSESAPNTLSVSGACNDPYFVVLLYKNASDYDANPSSYIFNRAFPCFEGQYSYSISELPFNLESGTFYLLIAGQGFKGPWKPISALMPVGITVTTVFPDATSTTDEPAP